MSREYGLTPLTAFEWCDRSAKCEVLCASASRRTPFERVVHPVCKTWLLGMLGILGKFVVFSAQGSCNLVTVVLVVGLPSLRFSLSRGDCLLGA